MKDIRLVRSAFSALVIAAAILIPVSTLSAPAEEALRGTVTVVYDGDRIVAVDYDIYIGGKPRHAFVYGIVDNFIHKMVQAALGRIAYIHGRAFSNSVYAFQHLYRCCIVLLLLWHT